MKYSRVTIESIGYELAPIVVTSAELEARLDPLYRALRVPPGQLEALTGIVERRWWEENFPVSQGATLAARKALATTNVRPRDIDVVIYAGVCREQFEPATACRVAAGLGVSPSASVYDLSNACLGVLNGVIDVANRIELGQIRAGLVVSCETAREINEVTIERMLREKTMDVFKESLATLTGGSGAVAVLVTDGSFGSRDRRRLLGCVTQSAPQYYDLCRWGLTTVGSAATAAAQMIPSVIRDAGAGLRNFVTPYMTTDAVNVLKHGVELGTRTWRAFLDKLNWAGERIDRVICHQVGHGHRDAILKTLGIPAEKDFTTYRYLGNIGTVSLPLTAALAEEQEFLRPGDKVGFLGIGSGLNCMMMGLKW